MAAFVKLKQGARALNAYQMLKTPEILGPSIQIGSLPDSILALLWREEDEAFWDNTEAQIPTDPKGWLSGRPSSFHS